MQKDKSFTYGMITMAAIFAGCFGLICYGYDLAAGGQAPKREIISDIAHDTNQVIKKYADNYPMLDGEKIASDLIGTGVVADPTKGIK